MQSIKSHLEVFKYLETQILKLNSPRGNLLALKQQDALEKSAKILLSTLDKKPNSSHNSIEKIIILTGFPCVKSGPVHQETDGISGAIALARAIGSDSSIIAIEQSSSFIIKKCFEKIGETPPQILE